MMPTASLADPVGADPMVAAAAWLQGTLLGSVATAVAVIAVAVVGMQMLSGRLSVRSGLTVVAGCFVLFGSATIADGILRIVGHDATSSAAITGQPHSTTIARFSPQEARSSPQSHPQNYDPYAGASVPQR